MLIFSSLFAQKNKLKFTGQLGVYGDFYSINSDTANAVKARRPPSVGRFVFNASLNYGKFSAPFSLMLSAGQTSVILPNIPDRNWLEYIKDPSNRVGIAPQYKWAQLLLGTQVPQYSELSIGDLPIFGAGLKLTPGLFRFSIFAGTSQLAIKEDTIKGIKGIYARNIYSAKIGVGREESSHFYFISTLMLDDTSSIKTNPVNSLPQKGILSAIDYRLNMGKQVYIKGEIAGSAFTRDTRSKELVIKGIDLPSPVFKVQESSRFDYATTFTIAKDGKKFGVKLSGKYIGDGFVPTGYPFMQTDRLEATIDPRFSLFKNKVDLTGSVGKRINNLSQARASTATQTIGNVDINIQFTERFSLNANYSNFDFRNSITNDTFRMQMITSSWSITPTYNYNGKIAIHVFTIMYAQNNFTDYNTISGALNANDSRNILLSHTLGLVNNPLSLASGINYFENIIVIGKLITQSAFINFGYKLLKNKLNTTTGITYTQNQINNNNAGSQIATNIGLKYALSKKMAMNANGTINLFKYGVDRPGISLRENIFRTSISYKF